MAEEYGMATSAIHFHYDTKDDLLAAFLDFLLAQFVDRVHEVEVTAPEQRLELLLDKLIGDAEYHGNLQVAMLEMRGQAPYTDSFSEQSQRNDEYTRYMLRTVTNYGNQEGAFDGVDAEHVARALMTIIDGARTRAVVLDDISTLASARRTADEYVTSVLLAEGE